MGFFTKIFGGTPDPKPFGGGFDPAIEEDAKYILGKLQSNVEQGIPEYVGDRFEGFTEEELQAFDLLKELAFNEPEFFKEAAGLREESLELFRDYAKPIAADDIARQRSILEPTVTAERSALQEALDTGLRNVGLQASLAGPGAATGSRQFLTALEQGKEFGRGTERIESRLSREAINMADAERQRLLPLARQTYTAGSDALQAGQDENRFRLGQVGVLGQVGKDKRDLAQREKDFDYSEFIRTQGDPNQLLRDYGNFVSRAPLRTTQYQQEPSTFQELIGGITAISGAAEAGASVPGFANQGGAIANLAMGSTPSTSPKTESFERMGIFSRLKQALLNKDEKGQLENQGLEGPPTKKQSEEIDEAEAEAGSSKSKPTLIDPDVSSIETKIYGRSGMYSGERGVYQKDGGQVVEAQGGGILGSLFSYPSKSQFNQLQQQAQLQYNEAMADGKLTAEEQAALVAGPVGKLQGLSRIDAAIARREPAADADDDAGLVTKIIRGAGKGLKYYAENIDPFKDLEPEQRLRVAFSILGETPGVAESPLITTARGASKGLAAIDAQELARAKIEATKQSKRKEIEPLPTQVLDFIREETEKAFTSEIRIDENSGERILYVDGNPIKPEGRRRIEAAILAVTEKTSPIYYNEPARFGIAVRQAVAQAAAQKPAGP